MSARVGERPEEGALNSEVLRPSVRSFVKEPLTLVGPGGPPSAMKPDHRRPPPGGRRHRREDEDAAATRPEPRLL